MKYKIKIGLTFLTFIMVAMCSFMLVACGEPKEVNLDVSAIDSDVATLNFELPSYRVGDIANFRVNFTDKYSQSDCNVYVDSKLIEKGNDENYPYTCKLNTENVKFEIKNYTVNTYTYEISGNNMGVVIVPEKETVTYGEDFSFTISEVERYNEGFSVHSYNGVLTPNNGVYTIQNVTSNVSIWFGNLTVRTFNVETEDCEGAWLWVDTSKDYSSYGTDVYFEISFQEGYIKGEDFKVTANGVELHSDTNDYVYENLTEDIVLAVEGVELQMFNVTYIGTEGLDLVSAPTKIAYGQKCNFHFYIKDEYAAYDGYVVYENGREIYSDVGYVDNTTTTMITLSSWTINDDIEFRVEGLTIKHFDINYDLPNGVAIDLSKDTVNYGEDATFTLSVLPGYDDSFFEPTVMVNNVAIYANDDGVYTIENITNQPTITVECELLANYYMFTTIPEGINIILEDESDIESVEYTVEDEIRFTIEIEAGYEQLSGFELSSNTGNLEKVYMTYVLTNITDNIEISVVGLSKINYEFEYVCEQDIDIEVVDEKDVYNIGDYYKFRINTEGEFTVTFNGEEIGNVGGVYSIVIIEDTPKVSEFEITIK